MIASVMAGRCASTAAHIGAALREHYGADYAALDVADAIGDLVTIGAVRVVEDGYYAMSPNALRDIVAKGAALVLAGKVPA
jgi:hypothetical protein